MSKHPCPAPDCGILVPREQYACRRHWFALPRSLRSAIWRAYRSGDVIELAELHAQADALLEAA